jgi:hypothetical protein
MPEHEKSKQRESQDNARDASRETNPEKRNPEKRNPEKRNPEKRNPEKRNPEKRNPEKLRYLMDELSAVMDSRREYFQHKNENAQSSPPRLRSHVLRPLRWILERARKRHAA